MARSPIDRRWLRQRPLFGNTHLHRLARAQFWQRPSSAPGSLEQRRVRRRTLSAPSDCSCSAWAPAAPFALLMRGACGRPNASPAPAARLRHAWLAPGAARITCSCHRRASCGWQGQGDDADISMQRRHGGHHFGLGIGMTSVHLDFVLHRGASQGCDGPVPLAVAQRTAFCLRYLCTCLEVPLFVFRLLYMHKGGAAERASDDSKL